MKNTYREIITSKEHPVSLEDVRLELGASFQAVEDAAVGVYRKEGLEVYPWTQSGIEILRQREAILSEGLRTNIEEKSLSLFYHGLVRTTSSVSNFIMDVKIEKDTELVGDVLRRYGRGIQGNMIINQMLTDEAMNALKLINDPEKI